MPPRLSDSAGNSVVSAAGLIQEELKCPGSEWKCAPLGEVGHPNSVLGAATAESVGYRHGGVGGS